MLHVAILQSILRVMFWNLILTFYIMYIGPLNGVFARMLCARPDFIKSLFCYKIGMQFYDGAYL